MHDLFAELERPLTNRLQRMVGDRGAAEDLRQEAFVRAWTSAPRDADRDHLRAWVHRTARNLAVDHLRRRAVRDWVPFADENVGSSPDPDPDARMAAREALDRLSPHERLLVLLRFEGGLSLAEIGTLLDISEDAARKRVARARAALAAARKAVTPRERPLILVLAAHIEDPRPYQGWIEAAGGEARVLDRDRFEREIASADGLVMSGSQTDIDPALYGQSNMAAQGEVDLGTDRRDLEALRTALVQDVPIVGICRGHQLLNIAYGGTLHQDIGGHDRVPHPVDTSVGSVARRVLGRGSEVCSEHHQSIARVGRGLRVTSMSSDGVVESIEMPQRSFAIGVQWHPEDLEGGPASKRLAEAFVHAAA
jgi:anthranilate synthase component 2/putative glutamine amidotransferase